MKILFEKDDKPGEESDGPLSQEWLLIDIVSRYSVSQSITGYAEHLVSPDLVGTEMFQAGWY